MTAPDNLTDKTMKVWRYMSYARFVWMLQAKQLWLSRADYLSDPWELSLAGDQLAHVIATAPISPVGEPPREPILQRSERIIKAWRQKTYISCWSAQAHESHALWRIYCPTSEGVAIQTTVAKLNSSVGDLPLMPVTYQTPGSNRKTPTLTDLATEKRPMFAYEHEVRVLHLADSDAPSYPIGFGLPWDCEQHVEHIYVHPEADQSFMETVIATVAVHAPSLKDRVVWSAMNEQRPF
ncbi:MAG: hypothetical protein ABL891_17340 [Burkholderiales bacterium]